MPTGELEEQEGGRRPHSQSPPSHPLRGKRVDL